jgi:hypothetical protein
MIDAAFTRRFATSGGPFDSAQGKLRPPLQALRIQNVTFVSVLFLKIGGPIL